MNAIKAVKAVKAIKAVNALFSYLWPLETGHYESFVQFRNIDFHSSC